MYEELKKALKCCTTQDNCLSCPYQDHEGCATDRMVDALNAIDRLERLVAYLLTLVNLTNTELQNSLNLEKMIKGEEDEL